MQKNFYDEFDNATPKQVLGYIKDCLKAEERGVSPQDIGGYITSLLGANDPFGWYEANKYPAFTKIMNAAPDLEIGNIWVSEKADFDAIKAWVVEFEQEIKNTE